MTGKSYPFNLVVSLHLTGSLAPDSLERALERLQREHPLLRCRIGRHRGEPVFECVEDAPEIPVRRVEREDDDVWQAAIESELARPVDAGRAPLARCVLVSEGAGECRHELLLTFHHSIVDAQAVVILLLGLLARLVGRPVEAPLSDAIPDSADERLPERFHGLSGRSAALRFLGGQLIDEARYRASSHATGWPTPPGDFRCRILPIALDEDATERLVRATRRRRVGVWSALTAAMLLAVVGARSPRRAAAHRYLAFPLLRSYLRPPVADDVVASYFSILRLTATVDPGAGLWELAATIHHDAAAASKRGEKFLSLGWSELMMKGLLGQTKHRMATVALNYAGAIELMAPGGGLSVDGIHAFVGNFPLGPPFTAQARVFERRLWLDIVYLDSELDADAASEIAASMRDRLLDASRENVGEPA